MHLLASIGGKSSGVPFGKVCLRTSRNADTRAPGSLRDRWSARVAARGRPPSPGPENLLHHGFDTHRGGIQPQPFTGRVVLKSLGKDVRGKVFSIAHLVPFGVTSGLSTTIHGLRSASACLMRTKSAPIRMSWYTVVNPAPTNRRTAYIAMSCRRWSCSIASLPSTGPITAPPLVIMRRNASPPTCADFSNH